MRGSLAIPKICPQNGFPSKRILPDLHRRSAFDKLGGLDEFTGLQVQTRKRICGGFGFMKFAGAPVKCPASATARETWR